MWCTVWKTSFRTSPGYLDSNPAQLTEPARSLRSNSHAFTGRSSAWIERTVRDREVAGSNPVAPTKPKFHAEQRLKAYAPAGRVRQRCPGKTAACTFWPHLGCCTPCPAQTASTSYRLHKARDLAVVTIAGKNHYLGPYGSPESHEKYARLIAEWRANRKHLLPTTAAGPVADRTLSLNELMLAYWRHVETY